MWRFLEAIVIALCVSLCFFSASSAQTATPVATEVMVLRDANLRAGPGTNFEIVGGAKAGDSLIVVGENSAGDWYELDNGAWIAAFLVTTSAQTPAKTTTPTSTPTRRSTPATPTPTATPQIEGSFPYTYTGTGDSIVDVSAYAEDIALLLIVGNDASRFFSVQSYDELNSSLDLLVNTTEPYVGLVPINLTRGVADILEVSAVGPWKIVVFPLSAADKILKAVKFDGEGDDVLLVVGTTARTATVTGNAQDRYFSIIGYSSSGRGQLLVNTTDPYNGVVRLQNETILLVVKAVGEWSVTLN